MALTPPVGQAGVPSTPLPSGQVDSLGSTASEALPSDNIPPPIFLVGGGEYGGFGATGQAGEGAIDPCFERLDGPARADGIGGTAVGLYSPPIDSEAGGEYLVLPR